jgi:hypothetical protein
VKTLACIFIGISTLAATPRAAADTITAGAPPLRVVPAAPPLAQPFNLHDVRLLDGEFKAGQDIAAKYLLSIETDRLLCGFRVEAGLRPKGTNYGGWERQSIAGHSLGHYLSGCSLAWASTGDARFLERVNYIVAELAECQRAGGDGYLAAFAGGRKAFAEVAAGNIRSSGFDLNGLWVPNYTEHKVLAGLRDAYRLARNTNALQVARGLADWYEKTLSGLNEVQMQQVLACEHGGMNEVLADLYADTGDPRYLVLSRRFHHKAILDPLARGEDVLPGKHANTQIPKLVGLATRYELTGAQDDRAAAEFFWERVVHHHTYVTGGNSEAEHFGPADRLNGRLSEKTAETCNVNNMLKLTEHVFGWTQSAGAADFYERALLNQIRSTQHPDGRVMYFLSLKPGHQKDYQRPYDDWSCCVGTGMENHVKYGAGIYYHSDDALWLNLFIASEVNWKQRGVVLRQETGWPESDHSTLTIQTGRPQYFALRIRHPHWADRLIVRVNGQLASDTTSPSSYAVIRRDWKDGDKIEIQFPMSLRLEAMPDNAKRVAVFYGPTLLAADLGEVENFAASQPGFVPVLVTDCQPVTEWVKPISLQRQTFKTVGVGKPHDVELVPLHKLHDRRYTVFLDQFTAPDWARREAELRAEEARQAALEARTVDVFQPGEMQPERDHHVLGDKSDPGEYLGRKFRHAWDGGWFSFQMKVDAAATNQLLCIWWGDETGPREFDILVDNAKIASQKLARNQPGQFWDATYAIPNELTRGKTSVMVRLQAQPGNYAGGLFGCRVLRPE